MANVHVSAERTIPSPPDALYSLLADYRVGHPSILPAAFSDFKVLEGGVGAGTRIRFALTLGGRKLTTEAHVTEPEPGRVLAEHYVERGMTTTFAVTSITGGSRLRIHSSWKARRGPAGWVERWLAPRLLRPLYEDELDRIERWASQSRDQHAADRGASRSG